MDGSTSVPGMALVRGLLYMLSLRTTTARIDANKSCKETGTPDNLSTKRQREIVFFRTP